MSNAGSDAATRNVAFYYGVSQRPMYNELGDINSPEKPRAPNGAGCQTNPRRVFNRMRCFSAPAQEDCPFTSGLSVQRPASLDVGHSSSTTSTMKDLHREELETVCDEQSDDRRCYGCYTTDFLVSHSKSQYGDVDVTDVTDVTPNRNGVYVASGCVSGCARARPFLSLRFSSRNIRNIRNNPSAVWRYASFQNEILGVTSVTSGRISHQEVAA